MSKSTGQILGTIAGGIIGAFVPGSYIALGASIGGMVGGAIDPPKGPQVDGPRLGDRQVQISTYGAVLPQVFGTPHALLGNVFYVENNALKEVATTEGGGKGGGGTQTTTYSYFATFAVALCRGPVAGHLRIWIAGGLWYDESATDMATIQTNAERKRYFRFYNGTDTQLPDPRMEAMLGVGNCPAYRGTCYIFFEELPLAEYGNSLLGAQAKVEVYCNGTVSNSYALSGMYEYGEEESGVANSTSYTDDPFSVSVPIRENSSSDFRSLSYHGGALQSQVLTLPKLPPHATASHGLGSVWGLDTSAHKLYLNGNECDYIPGAGRDIGTIWNIQLINGVLRVAGTSTNPAPSWIGVLSLSGTDAAITNWVESAYYDEIPIFGDRFGTFYQASGVGSTPVIMKFYDDALNLEAQYTFPSMPEINLLNPYNGSGDNFTQRGQIWCVGSLVYVLVERLIVGVYYYAVAIFNLADLTCEFRNLAPSINHKIYHAHIFRVWESGVISLTGNTYTLLNDTGTPQRTYVYSPVRSVSDQPVTLASIVSALCSNSRLESADITVTSLNPDLVRGYSVASAGSPRVAIEQLQAPWPFDIVPHEYGIKFVRRPTASVLSIPESDLGAVPSGSSPEVRLKEAREMDSQLPQRISIRYADFDREYDIGEQYDEAQNIASANQRIIDLNIVLTATEAVRVAQQLRLRAAVERSAYSFVLPPMPDYLKIQPADVVTVVTSTASHKILLTRVQLLPDGRIECEGVRNAAAVYSPTAVGVSGTALPQTIKSTGPSYGLVLDIPQVHDDQGVSGVLVAMRGYSSYGSWPGAAAVLTRDAETSWVTAAGLSLGHESTMGICLTALPSPPTFGMVDSASSLNVILHTGELNSISRAQLLNNNNALAIGVAGRWEVVLAQNCVETEPGKYTLSNFLRGRFGTEWAASLHQKGDAVVLLDANKVAWGKLPTSDFDVSRQWRFVTNGRAIDTAENNSFTYSGVNLECLSPVKARTYKASNGDLVSSWKRRTRFNGEWRNRVDIPLNETAEKYDVVIYTDSTRAVVKRTYANLTTPACTYSNADQVTDFGSTMYQVYARAFQISELRGRGYGLDFVMSGAEVDPYWSSVSLACHCNGPDNSADLIDEKGRVFTRVNSTAKITTARSKFGGSSAVSPNTGSYWKTASNAGMQVGSGNFTCSFWCYAPATTSFVLVEGGASVDYAFFVAGGGQASFNYYISSSLQALSNAAAVPLNTWCHVEFGRSGNNLYIFINGTLNVTRTLTAGSIRDSAGTTKVAGASTYACAANVNDLLFTKGVCRHTTSFTPPPNPFPNR